jgi:hypothetical protein
MREAPPHPLAQGADGADVGGRSGERPQRDRPRSQWPRVALAGIVPERELTQGRAPKAAQPHVVGGTENQTKHEQGRGR